MELPHMAQLGREPPPPAPTTGADAATDQPHTSEPAMTQTAEQTTRLVKATEINPGRMTLADGSVVTRHSIQRAWVYVTIVRPGGRVGRRRYRHDQMVEVQS